MSSVTLLVDQNVTVNPQLSVGSVGSVVHVQGAAQLINAQTPTVGQVIDQRTVQQMPLNGRHFLDLTNLTPGTVVPPLTENLTSASRGLGANSFDTAGQREDSVNFMINGVNLNDASQNQITFQPSINTTAEFKISNSSYSAEYGRPSGSIVNVATRSGTNEFHGEAFDYLRNNYFDARNFFNRKPVRQNAFIRNNFGGAFSGPIWRDKTFFFLSYEGLRQAQAILFNGNVLGPAQRAAFSNSPAGPAAVSNVVSGLAGNPPNANPISETGSLPVGTLVTNPTLALLGPSATNPLFSNAYTESYSLNVQQQIGWGAVMEIGFIGSEGKHLPIQRNFNQFIYPNGKHTRPYPALSTSSPIRPGSALGNIPYVDSISLSNYNALWVKVRKALSHGIELNSTYAWSKSMDLNSLGSQGTYTLQNNFNPKGDYGLSDFDARNHFVFPGPGICRSTAIDWPMAGYWPTLRNSRAAIR